MKESNFSFVNNEILRQNIDEAFDHVITLLPFTESTTYNDPAKSAFRKTIIIHTGSIVEALLFHIIDVKFKDEDISDFYSTWELKNKKTLYIIDDSHEIVAGEYNKILGKTSKEKMNLAQIISFLKENKILGKSLHDKVDKLRLLRNDQHIGTHTSVKSYTKVNLEEAFSVASEVKQFVKNLK